MKHKKEEEEEGEPSTQNKNKTMATSQHLLLSPAELAYLRSALQLRPTPVRPDGRGPTQFRPLSAETGILPGTNGSARVCFADGSEAVVGVKAEVERSRLRPSYSNHDRDHSYDQTRRKAGEDIREGEEEEEGDGEAGDNDWVEMTVEAPGYRDDDSSTIFLATMLSEALLADGQLTRRLWINRRFHWKLYVDVS